MDGSEFIKKLKLQFDITKDGDLAKILGQTNLSQWKDKNLSPNTIAKAMKRMSNLLEKKLIKEHEKNANEKKSNAIDDIFEYVPIEPHLVGDRKRVTLKVSANYEIKNFKESLTDKSGIYVFYNSTCDAIYVGQAKKTDMWTEINSAYQREFKSITIQQINHPKLNHKKSTKKLAKHAVKIHETASYLSVYEVDPLFIDKIEAIMIRSFANQLLFNTKMESLSHSTTS